MLAIINLKIYLCSMFLKTLFLLPYLYCNVKFQLLQLISQHQVAVWDFNSWNRNAAWVSKQDKCRTYWVLINAFWIHLRIVRYRFVRYGYKFRFLVTDIPSKHFLIFSKTSWQRLQDMSSRRFQDMKST